MMSDATKNDWDRLNSIFQAITLPIFTWHATAGDFELIDFNKAAVDFSGDSLKESLSIRASLYYKNEPDILGDFKQCYEEKKSIEREIAYGSNSLGKANFLNVKYIYIQPDIILVQIQEITKQKEVKRILTNHIKQQAAFIENSPVAIAMFDTDMRYLSASNMWVTDYKLQGQEIIGKSHYDIFPEIGEDWKGVHQRCLQGAIEKREEDYFVRLDGNEVWNKWEIHPWYTDSKEIGGIIMFTENITARKNSEERLRESENRFHLLADNSLVGTYILKEGRYIYVNKEMARIFGYRVDELIGQTPKELLNPIVKNEIGSKKANGGISNHWEVTGKHRNGKILELEIFGAVTKINNSDAEIGTLIDISERKAAEKLMKEDRDKLKKILQTLPFGLSISNSAQKFEFFNTRMTEMLGYELEDFPDVETSWKVSFPDPEYRQELVREWRDVDNKSLASSGPSKHLQAKIRCKDGSYKIVEAYYSLVGDQSINIVQDITERKAKEALFEQLNERLTAQNELLLQAKDEIELNESRLIEAQNAAKIGSWETDLSTLLVVWSEETYSIFELDSTVFSPTHESFLSFVHEEDKVEVNNAFVNSFNASDYHSIEHRIVSAKGNLKYVEERWRVLKNKQGDPIRVYGSCQDITERKLIELELNNSKRQIVENENRLKLAVHAAELGVWDWNILNNEVVWNNIMDQIHGLEKDFKGDKYKVWVDSLHPEDKDKAINKLSTAINSLDNFHTSFRIIKCNGDIAYIKADTVVLRNESGEPYRMIGINMDITAQKNAENKLVEYKHFFQNSNEFLNIANTNGYYEIVNRQMVKTLGYSEKELLAKPFYEGIHPADVEAVSEEVDLLSKGGTTQNFQVRHSKKDGENIWIEWNVISDKSNGKIYSIGRDITERKKALELIKYQFENAPDVILVVNRDFIVESINRGITHKKEDFIGKYCLDFLPEESRDITEKTLIKCFATGKRNEIEHKVGMDRWVCSRFVPMVIDGEINQVMIFGSDITSQKQAEKELKESEEKYRAITENITDAILLIDKEFNLIYRSPANHKITGYSSEDFQNMDVTNLIHKEDLAKSLLNFQEVYGIPTSSSNFKVRVLHKDGHWLWIEGSIVNMLGNETIKAIVVSFRDVTDRVKVEEELALASLIVNSTEDAIVSKTNDNIINSWNHGAEKVFGYSAEEAIGQSIYMVIPTNLYEEERIISDDTSKGKPIKHLETQRIRKGGGIIDVSLTISPILCESGKVIGASKIMRDITVRKKLELERNKIIDDLMQRNRDLEQFSYIISHNLRAPVANIIGISSLIQSLDLISTEKDLVAGLTESALGLDIVIKDLNYILQKKREVNENKVRVKFADIIIGIQANISSWIKQENVTFISDFSSKNEMFTIKSYLFSIFYNLISNSIKYRDPNRNPVIKIKSCLQDNGFRIVFRDNGLGIDLDNKGDQVFGLYKRFHFHTEGKGMGLYMVKTQLESLGGKVSIKSKVNVGTEVTIEFENY